MENGDIVAVDERRHPVAVGNVAGNHFDPVIEAPGEAFRQLIRNLDIEQDNGIHIIPFKQFAGDAGP